MNEQTAGTVDRMNRPLVVCSAYAPGTPVLEEDGVFAEAPDVAFVVRGPARTPAQVIHAVGDADVVLHHIEPFTREVFAALPRLRGIVRYGIGLDTIDVDAATEYGVVVANFPTVTTREVAHHALALMLACAKKLLHLDHDIRSGARTTSVAPMGSIYGETLGLIAFGNIPHQLAPRAQALGMHVIAYDPYLPPENFVAAGVESVDLESVARRSDYVSCHLPLTDETRDMIDASFFSKMKPTAFFINTARGAILKEADLVAALREGRIAGAGLDVYEVEPPTPDNPLCAFDNVILTPHSASHSDLARSTLHRRAALSALALARGGLPEHVVNPDALQHERWGGLRCT